MAFAPERTSPRGWRTFDNIPNIDYVRNNLAVTPEFKAEIGYVQRYLIPKGTPIQKGTAGPQSYNGVIYAIYLERKIMWWTGNGYSIKF